MTALLETSVDARSAGWLEVIGAGLRTLITVNGHTAQDSFTGAIAALSDLGDPEHPVAIALQGRMNNRQ